MLPDGALPDSPLPDSPLPETPPLEEGAGSAPYLEQTDFVEQFDKMLQNFELGAVTKVQRCAKREVLEKS